MVKMISENYKLVIMIAIRFIQMGDGQNKTPKVGCVAISDNRCNIQRIPGGSSNLELKPEEQLNFRNVSH